jgi:hypothetical protein
MRRSNPRKTREEQLNLDSVERKEIPPTYVETRKEEKYAVEGDVPSGRLRYPDPDEGQRVGLPEPSGAAGGRTAGNY